ncbi:Enolase, N-terminal domain [Sparganum proliferum]
MRAKILVTQAGNMTFPFDKPEQVIDFFVGYLKDCGLESSFTFGLQIEPYAMYDEARNTYDPISGLAKSPNDLAKFYRDLSQTYPQIRLFIDPFRAEDAEAWHTLDELLSSRQSDRPFLCSSTTASQVTKPTNLDTIPEAVQDQTLLHRATSPSVAYISRLARGEEVEVESKENAAAAREKETSIDPPPSEVSRARRETKAMKGKQRGKQEEESVLPPPPPPSPPHKVSACWMWSCAITVDCLLVTEMAQAVAYMQKQGKTVIFDVDGVDVDENWTLDLAIGLGCDFVKFSGPGCSDTVRKMDYWLSALEDHAAGCAQVTPFTCILSEVDHSSNVDA